MVKGNNLFSNILQHYYKQSNYLSIHIIMSGNYISMKFLINFGFCVSKQRLQGAEAILTAIYERSELIFSREKQILKQSKKKSHQPEIVHRQLLEEIKDSVQKLNKSKEGSISKQIQQELLNIFIPTQGQSWKQILQINQPWRYELGINKKKLISVYPHSGLLSFIIRMLYKKNEIGKLIAPISSYYRVNYIVGTSGLGKSFKFYAIKHFHDLRIPQIIANGPDKNSIFDINYKFLYVSAGLQLQKIFQMIESELQKDFQNHQGKLQGIFKKVTVDNFSVQLNKVIRLYSQNHIKLKLIVDQANDLYHLLQTNKLKELETRVEIFSDFSLSSGPVFLVSSKNNRYRSARIDPIFRIAMSRQGSIKHNKYTVDDFISAEQRLLSSVESLLFELEKLGINRDIAIEIVKGVNIGFQTHLQIATAVQAQKQKILKEGPQMCIKRLNDYFQITEDSIVKAIEQAYQNIVGIELSQKQKRTVENGNQKTLQYFIRLFFHLMYFIFNHRGVETVSVNLDVKTEDNNCVRIFKEGKIISKSLKDTQTDQQSNFLRDVNFFFFHQKGKDSKIFFCTPPGQVQNLKYKIISYLDIYVLNQLSNFQDFEEFLGSHVGLVFKVIICNAYYQGKKVQSQVNTTIKNIEFTHKVKAKPNPIKKKKKIHKNPLKYFEIATIDLVKQIVISDKSINSMNYFAAKPMQPSFDFVLSSYKNEKLKLVLIDTTISTQERSIVKKIVKFKGKLLNNGDFNALLTKLSESGQISSIQLFYYVLIPETADNQNLYDVNLISKTESRVIEQIQKQIVELQKKKQLLKKQQDLKKEQLLRKQQFLKKQKLLKQELQKLQEIVDLYNISEDSVKKFKEKFDKIAKIETVAGVLGEHFIIENTKKQQTWVQVMQKLTELRQNLRNRNKEEYEREEEREEDGADQDENDAFN